MVRMLLTYVLPLFLPTILYFAWAAWVRAQITNKHAKEQDTDTPATTEEVAAYDISAPWFRLILAGVALVVIGLVLSVILSPKNPPKSVYQPPHMENGKVIPGHYQQIR